MRGVYPTMFLYVIVFISVSIGYGFSNENQMVINDLCDGSFVKCEVRGQDNG